MSVAIEIVGGVYRERCLRPAWNEIFGSAGRAASAMSMMGHSPILHSYLNGTARNVLLVRAALESFELGDAFAESDIEFDYDHGLATPRIMGDRTQRLPLNVSTSRILRFGLIEGDAIVHGDQVVYDPQNAESPEPFGANGSTARSLAYILNQHEASVLSGLRNCSASDMAMTLMQSSGASVVIIKQGPFGALVHDGQTIEQIPAYRSKSVWKIGSGDNFSAHFALRWMHEQKSAAESADLASRATAYYCETRGFASPDILKSFAPDPVRTSPSFQRGRQPCVYLAGPFFSLAQLWLIDQARSALRSLGLKVFSPYHDVGQGSAEDVVELDLAGIRNADLIFAVGDGLDSGTIYEIGYARAVGKPVVMYCENESLEDKKMMQGSGCEIHCDYVSAVYATLWAACAL